MRPPVFSVAGVRTVYAYTWPAALVSNKRAGGGQHGPAYMLVDLPRRIPTPRHGMPLHEVAPANPDLRARSLYV
jgi:hypothetical protein